MKRNYDINMDNIQRRAIDDVPTIETDDKTSYCSGYALKFGVNSCDLGGYIETIEREALTDEIIQNSDIFAFINHDERLGVLARSRFGKGKLSLTIDDVGLHYSFKLGKSPVCEQLRQYLEDEIITKSSFAFTVAEGGYEWIDNQDGTPFIDENGLQRLKIKQFNLLYDISPVFEPAYNDTECKLHTSNSIDENIIIQMNERKLKHNIHIKNKLDEYFTNIRKKYRIR